MAGFFLSPSENITGKGLKVKKEASTNILQGGKTDMGRILPILFNTDMVLAVLEGRKTSTRRKINADKAMEVLKSPARIENPGIADKEFIRLLINQPCEPGDILYVRETWSEWTDGYVYKAWPGPFPQAGCYPSTTWHPSIHMPKEAARIFLKVTDVCVEQIQDMKPDDAVREGIHFCKCPDGFTWKPDTDMENCYTTPLGAMQALWDTTVRKPDLKRYGWAADPWVWAIGFERCGKPGGMI